MNSKIFIGIDIEQISEVSNLLKLKNNSLEKIFSKEELKLSEMQLAGNFSAKEAIIKAFSSVTKLFFSQIEIQRDVSGRPIVSINGQVELRNFSLDLSISNKLDLVVAVAIVQIH